MERIICLLIGYLFGIIQTGFIYGKIKHIDIRKHGSGNAGATNALRTLGWKAGATTFTGDALKAVAAVLIAKLIFADSPQVMLLGLYAGMGVVLGHNYPFYLKFKGGKGIASTVGLMLATDPVIFLTILAIFLVIFLTTKYVSLGSLVCVLVFAVEFIIFGQMGKYGVDVNQLHEMYGLVIFLAALGWWRHRANIQRLLKGTENKIIFSQIKK